MNTPDKQKVNKYDELARKLPPTPFTVGFIDGEGTAHAVLKYYTASQMRLTRGKPQVYVNEMGVWLDISYEYEPKHCYRVANYFPN